MLIYVMMMDDPQEQRMFEQVYMKYRKLMFVVAQEVLRDEQSAEDVVHTTFMKLIDNMDKIDEVDSNRTKRLLITMTKNTAIDVYRKRNRYDEQSYDAMEQETAVTYDTIESENVVVTAIRALPDKYRELFLLKYSAGYENSEIAQVLGISEATIRKQLSRGKAKLEKILQSMEVV